MISRSEMVFIYVINTNLIDIDLFNCYVRISSSNRTDAIDRAFEPNLVATRLAYS